MYDVPQPFASGFLSIGNGEEIYWETSGNPNGGPGGGLNRKYRQHFDPEKYFIVGFEQRGCGRSKPLAHEDLTKLASNTTQNLISDVELLRKHLKVESWFLFGGSWGTTLALAYAEEHPARTRGLVLAAITTTTAKEVDWITDGMRKIFPREGDALISAAQPQRNERVVDACYRKIMDSDPKVRLAIARAWCIWEDTHMSIHKNWPGSEFIVAPNGHGGAELYAEVTKAFDRFKTI